MIGKKNAPNSMALSFSRTFRSVSSGTSPKKPSVRCICSGSVHRTPRIFGFRSTRIFWSDAGRSIATKRRLLICRKQSILKLRKYSRAGIERPAFRLRLRSDRSYSDSFVATLFLCVVPLSKGIKTSARIDPRIYGQYTAAAPIEITFPTIKLASVAQAKRDMTISDLTRASG